MVAFTPSETTTGPLEEYISPLSSGRRGFNSRPRRPAKPPRWVFVGGNLGWRGINQEVPRVQAAELFAFSLYEVLSGAEKWQVSCEHTLSAHPVKSYDIYVYDDVLFFGSVCLVR